MTPRGRIDGLGWVKQGEDENLENALNALAYPDSDAAFLTHRVCTGSSTVSVLCFVSPPNTDTSWLSAGGHLKCAAVLTARTAAGTLHLFALCSHLTPPCSSKRTSDTKGVCCAGWFRSEPCAVLQHGCLLKHQPIPAGPPQLHSWRQCPLHAPLHRLCASFPITSSRAMCPVCCSVCLQIAVVQRTQLRSSEGSSFQRARRTSSSTCIVQCCKEPRKVSVQATGCGRRWGSLGPPLR